MSDSDNNSAFTYFLFVEAFALLGSTIAIPLWLCLKTLTSRVVGKQKAEITILGREDDLFIDVLQKRY